ncbi:MAG: sterol desaturase family protein [Acidimicrobiales bacterium]
MAGIIDEERNVVAPCARYLTTRRQVAAAVIAAGSGRVLLVGVVALAALRLTLALAGRPLGLADLVAAVAVVALVGPVEWVIHKLVLHAPVESRRLGILGVGLGHRAHHAAPDDLRWITLDGREAGGALLGFGVVSGVVSSAVALALGAPVIATAFTGWLLAAVALTHYEFVHLLVHSGHRPTSRFYATLDRHHRLHHHRNEQYWLGVTSRTGDRLFRTLPRSKGDVPRSETTRTLSR